jgi:hypothetical protein
MLHGWRSGTHGEILERSGMVRSMLLPFSKEVDARLWHGLRVAAQMWPHRLRRKYSSPQHLYEEFLLRCSKLFFRENKSVFSFLLFYLLSSLLVMLCETLE